MATEPAIAFAPESLEQPGLEIRVNFGMFAGREATPAEIDELAAALLPKVGEVSIVSEQRHEISTDLEVSLHQVRIDVDESELPEDPRQQDELRGRLLEIAERWAQACFAERHAEISEP
jgi:hypothetical protein